MTSAMDRKAQWMRKHVQQKSFFLAAFEGGRYATVYSQVASGDAYLSSYVNKTNIV